MAKKKAAKKAAKKKGAKKQPKPTADKTIVILKSNKFRKGDFKKPVTWLTEDTVQWVNKSAKRRVVMFVTGWPFYGTQHTITVAAYDNSEVLQVDNHKPKYTTYDYTISPQVLGPPDGPAVIVNGG